MVDLHLHTTVSDGRLAPAELVERVAAAGVRVMAVTDHDTTRATADVQHAAAAFGIEAIAGIEITAVEGERDIHILGYFLRDDETFEQFLAEQRELRIRRVADFARTLAALDMPIDIAPRLEEARLNPGRSLGRPQVALAMIAAGHVASMDEAFDRWLAYGRPAFVARQGPDCEAVIARIHHAGGLASLAHPGKTRIDGRLPALCDAGLDAIEAYHSDHDVREVERYRVLARRFGVLLTGGSDFHGDPSQHRTPGGCVLPEDDWLRLKARARTDG